MEEGITQVTGARSTKQQQLSGRLELTWTNKHLRLLAHEDGSYQWVPASDWRVSEVRLLNDMDNVGAIAGRRANDNLLIEGDALSGLTSLIALPEFAREYAGRVKLCYIDPPFNTQQSNLNYDDALEHSVWLTMMRDRLTQIRGLLAQDGSVWLHLDDSEAHRARVVMDEVFGTANFAGSVIWQCSDNSNNDAKKFSEDHNTILVYSVQSDWTSYHLSARPDQLSHFKNPDNDPNGPWFDGNPVNSPNPRPNLMYTITSPTGVEIPPPSNGWRWSEDTLWKKIESGEIRFSEDGRGIRRRTYLKGHPGLPPSSLWVDIERTGHNRQAKYELKKLFPDKKTADLFKTPKPEALMREIIQVATQKGDIVLDPFLGSGTTAAVAHKMGRRWVGIEWSTETVTTYARPRLERVVEGRDPGGVTRASGWPGGGGFRHLRVSPSMFLEEGGVVYLADWAVNGRLAEVTAAQLGFDFESDPPFSGAKGKKRLAVLDGLVNEAVVRAVVQNLAPGERVTICGTAIDPSCRVLLKELRPGSALRKIPASILDEYLTRSSESDESWTEPGLLEESAYA